MARIPVACGCIDAGCCGCDEVVLTGEDAIEAAREHDDAQDILDRDKGCGACDDCDECDGYECDDPMDGDFDTAMASAGHGMDEDYSYGPCDDAWYEDQVTGAMDY
jgi:hypothetical protein